MSSRLKGRPSFPDTASGRNKYFGDSSAATFMHVGRGASAPGQFGVEEADTVLGILEDAVQA